MSKTISVSFCATLIAFSFAFLSVTPAFAQIQGSGGGTIQSSGGGTVQGSGGGGTGRIENPLRGIDSVSQFIEKILKAVVLIGVPIAVLFLVLAGFRFITAQGAPEELKKARANFVHVVIGIAIFIGAWELANLILYTLRSIGISV